MSFNLKVVSWQLTGSKFVAIAVLLNTFLYNSALFSFMASQLDIFSASGVAIIATVTAVAFVFNVIVLSTITVFLPFLIKPFVALTALINSFALYYMFEFQVFLDITMMGNIFNTKSSEASELLSPMLLVFVITLGIIPAWLILKIKLTKINRISIITNMIIGTIVGVLFIYMNSASWLWIDKYSKIVGGKILPWSYVINSIAFYAKDIKSSKNQVLLPDGQFTDDDKTVVVLVIGETARSHNFSLYGYPRETNPLLSKSGSIALQNSRSCTTYTTGSVACMLSYDVKNTDSYETLPSYLTRLGADVIWRSGNWGEPPVTVTEYNNRSDLKKNCTGKGCSFDELLLSNLPERIESSDANKIFVILHTKGSHGPSYYSRYPEEFEKYTPVCRHEEISSKCSQEELINAYDNSILYTDYFLNQTIKKLKALNIPAMMVYISDHGESLGEEGLYLHGTPYMFAPDYQKDIPFIIWTSKEFDQLKNIDLKSIKQKDHYSHANVFHTVIGALGLSSDIYNQDLDVLHQ